jgi:hypothetical protein
MGAGMEVLCGRVTAPGAVFTPWTNATGVSLQVKNCPFDKKVYLIDQWAFNQVVGALRVRSPRLHDNVQGIRTSISAADPKPHLGYHFRQPLIPQDVLIAEQSGSGVGGQIELGALQLYYEELPGIAGQFADYVTVFDRGMNMVTVELALVPGATGDFTGQQAINALFDTLKANTWYALIGAHVTANCLGVGIRGVDTGNLRVMVPGDALGGNYTRDYFERKSRFWNLPLIPCFNSANKFSIFVDVVQNQAAGALTWTGILVELAPDWMQLQQQRRAS